MLVLTVAFSVALSRVTGYPLPAVVLAFAPGGLAEMSLIALALSVDAAFVASHHIARIIMVVTLAPSIFRILRPQDVARWPPIRCRPPFSSPRPAGCARRWRTATGSSQRGRRMRRHSASPA